VYDQQLRTELARDRAANLKADWPVRAPSTARQTLGRRLIAAGSRLAPESRPGSALAHEALRRC
jgi:hypothetical protein